MYPIQQPDLTATLHCSLEHFFNGSYCSSLLDLLPLDRVIIKDYQDPIFVTPEHSIDLNGFSQTLTMCICLVQNIDNEMPELQVTHFHQPAIRVADVIGSTAYGRRAALFLVCGQQPIKMFLMNLLTGEIPPDEMDTYEYDYGLDDDAMD